MLAIYTNFFACVYVCMYVPLYLKNPVLDLAQTFSGCFLCPWHGFRPGGMSGKYLEPEIQRPGEDQEPGLPELGQCLVPQQNDINKSCSLPTQMGNRIG